MPAAMPACSNACCLSQNVTVCPFRVVDEINQGMDPVYERKVFLQLVEAALQPGTPQCFLLTPKLLPNLPFHSDVVRILQIMNGPLISSVANTYRPVRPCPGAAEQMHRCLPEPVQYLSQEQLYGNRPRMHHPPAIESY